MLRTLLLDETTIRRELGVTASQKDKLAELSRQFREQRSEAFRNADKLTDQERATTFRALADGNEKSLSAILTADQARRLKQIALQQQGVPAFANPTVAATLHLSSKQQASIAGLLEEAYRRARLAVRPERGPAEADEVAGQIAKETERKILDLLDADQAAQWRAMTGTLFRGRIHFLARGSFGLDFSSRPPPPDEWGGPKGPPPGDNRQKGGPPGDGRFEGKKKKG